MALALGATVAVADERIERGVWQAPRLEAGYPDPRGSEMSAADRAREVERLVALQEKDPAGFRDLLRRSLAARLLWAVSGRPLPPDLPVELAGR